MIIGLVETSQGSREASVTEQNLEQEPGRNEQQLKNLEVPFIQVCSRVWRRLLEVILTS